MSIIIRLQNLPWDASALDIRKFFFGLSIPDGGVHIIGGEKGDAFIAFSTDEDARQAMRKDGGFIHNASVKLYLSSKTEMQNVISGAKVEENEPMNVNPDYGSMAFNNQSSFLNQGQLDNFTRTSDMAWQDTRLANNYSNQFNLTMDDQQQDMRQPGLRESSESYINKNKDSFDKHDRYLKTTNIKSSLLENANENILSNLFGQASNLISSFIVSNTLDNSLKLDNSEMSYCIFITRLPDTYNYKEIRRLFRHCNIPNHFPSIKVMNNSRGKRIGQAYIQLLSQRAVDEALRLDGNIIDGRSIKVISCSQKEFDDAIDSYHPLSDGEENKYYYAVIKNVTDRNLLKQFLDGVNFHKNGLFIEKDKHGMLTGHSLVKLSSKYEHSVLMDRHKTAIDGKLINVFEIKQREFDDRVTGLKSIKDLFDKEQQSDQRNRSRDRGIGKEDRKSRSRSRKRRNSNIRTRITKEDERKTCAELFGLNWSTTKIELINFFKGYGVVPDSVKILLDDNGKPNGLAYIEFENEEELKRCHAKKNNEYLGTRYISIRPITKEIMFERYDKYLHRVNKVSDRLKENESKNKGASTRRCSRERSKDRFKENKNRSRERLKDQDRNRSVERLMNIRSKDRLIERDRNKSKERINRSIDRFISEIEQNNLDLRPAGNFNNFNTNMGNNIRSSANLNTLPLIGYPIQSANNFQNEQRIFEEKNLQNGKSLYEERNFQNGKGIYEERNFPDSHNNYSNNASFDMFPALNNFADGLKRSSFNNVNESNKSNVFNRNIPLNDDMNKNINFNNNNINPNIPIWNNEARSAPSTSLMVRSPNVNPKNSYGLEATMIYLRNLNPAVQLIDILEFFRGYNPIRESIKLLYKDNARTGIGMMAFGTRQLAEMAVRDLNGRMLLGNQVFLTF